MGGNGKKIRLTTGSAGFVVTGEGNILEAEIRGKGKEGKGVWFMDIYYPFGIKSIIVPVEEMDGRFLTNRKEAEELAAKV